MTASSNTPLLKKLGVPAHETIAVLNSPTPYKKLLGALPEGTQVKTELRAGKFGFIHFFAHSEAELEKRFPALKTCLLKDGLLWISWPKKASQVETDLNDNRVREIGLDAGLVDIKVCSVDETWSGLKFVYRKEDRG
jgi:hypothetical protein